MRRRIFFIIMLLVSLLPFSRPAPARGQSSDAPYIYYYSDEINAFIIERADGTDTRILGAGLMPPIDNRAYISGPGWSPSGKWFAWQLSQVGDYGQGYYKTLSYALKADGSQRLTLLDGLKNVQMAWAPHSDLLFIASQYFEPSADLPAGDLSNGYLHTDFYLIDVNADRVLNSEKQSVYEPDGDSYPPAPVIVWLDDTHVITEYASPPASDQDDGLTTYFCMFDTQGSSIVRAIEYALPSQATDNGFYDYPGAISASGTIVFRSFGLLYTENLLTGERHAFGAAPQHLLQIQWSPDGHDAIVMGDNLYLLALDSGQLTAIFTPKVPFPSLADYPLSSLWSADSSHALWFASGQFYHYSVADNRLEKLPVPANCNDDCVGWQWKDSGRAVIEESSSQSTTFYTYDFNAKTNTSAEVKGLFFIGPGPDFQPDVSADGRHIAKMYSDLTIYDTQTGAQRQVPPAARSWGASQDGEVAWHPDGQWLLTFQSGLVASGGPCCRHIGVVRADGTAQRDLTFVSYPVTGATVGWLPPQVSLSDLFPPLKKPLYPSPAKSFTANDWVTRLSWSPDGKQLLSGGGQSSATVMQWDMAAARSTVAFATMSDNQAFAWQQNQDGTYAPQLVTKPNLDWGRVFVAGVSPDGQRAFAYDADTGFYGVYDLKTHSLIHQIGDQYSYLLSVGFSPNDRLLAISDNQSAQIWDTQTWQVVATLRYPAPAVAFSPDGKWLATSRLWDIDLWSVHDLLAWGKPTF